MILYKQCSNGHYYQGERCPYCDENDTKTYRQYGLSPSSNCKVCINNHAYYSQDSSCSCPYCGESEIKGFVDMHTGQGYHIIIRSAGHVIKVTINEEEYKFYDLEIGYWVWVWQDRIKSNYMIATCDKNIYINANTIIKIGNNEMTGSGFIKMCDVIIDNQLAIIGM